MRTLPPVACLLLAVACSPAVVDINLDVDGDGELDDVITDSDDGTDDTANGDDTGLADLCSEVPIPTGHAPGEIASDFTVVDQNGTSINLYSLCDKAVLLESAAFW